MDFGKVDAAFGKKDGKWAVKVSMKGLVDSADKVKYDGESGKPSQQVYVTDGPGRRERVKVMGNFPDLLTMDLSQTFVFDLWATEFQGRRFYKGFCNVPDDRTGPATEPTPNTRYDYKSTQQGPPQEASQPTPAQKEASQNGVAKAEETNLGKCRHTLYCATIKAGCTPITLAASRDLLLAIEQLAHKSMHGLKLTDDEKFQVEQDLTVDEPDANRY